MPTVQTIAYRRRLALLAKIRAHGGRCANELMDWSEGESNNPLRVFRLREATLRNDLLLLLRAGLVTEGSKKVPWWRDEVKTYFAAASPDPVETVSCEANRSGGR